MPSSGYAKNTTGYLKSEDIEFIEKSKNAPYVLEYEGYKNFGHYAKKQTYSKHKKVLKTHNVFCQVWKRISFKISREHGKKVAGSCS